MLYRLEKLILTIHGLAVLKATSPAPYASPVCLFVIAYAGYPPSYDAGMAGSYNGSSYNNSRRTTAVSGYHPNRELSSPPYSPKGPNASDMRAEAGSGTDRTGRGGHAQDAGGSGGPRGVSGGSGSSGMYGNALSSGMMSSGMGPMGMPTGMGMGMDPSMGGFMSAVPMAPMPMPPGSPLALMPAGLSFPQDAASLAALNDYILKSG